MAWDDWVFGALTGGLYNVGKTAYKAGKAADKAGDALEEISDGAGTALAAVGSTVTKLGKDLSSFLKELEELLTIKRVAPRSEDDLWDEEVERLKALRKREAELVAELKALQASDDDNSWADSFWGAIFGNVSFEELAVRTRLAVVRKAINEILYEEPGVVPTTIHNFQLILERFNTLEQPRIEEILDSVNDNLEEFQDLQKELKKLFVVRTWRAVPVAELPEVKRKKLKTLEDSLLNVDRLIDKKSAVSARLQEVLVAAQPATFTMSKLVGTSLSTNGSARDAEAPGARDATTAATPTATANLPGLDRPVLHAVLASGPSFALKGKVSHIAMQPIAASVASALNKNAVSAYLDNYHAVEGRLRFYERERMRIQKTIFRIKMVPVDEPGVIPKILEEVRQVLSRFRTEGQPRLEAILDSVNGTVVESKAVLANVNTSLKSVQGAFDFVARNGTLIKVGLIIESALFLLLLLLGVVALVRVVFGF